MQSCRHYQSLVRWYRVNIGFHLFAGTGNISGHAQDWTPRDLFNGPCTVSKHTYHRTEAVAL